MSRRSRFNRRQLLRNSGVMPWGDVFSFVMAGAGIRRWTGL